MAIGFPSGTASLTLTNLNNGFATTGTPSYVNVVGMDISPTGDRVFLASRDTDSVYRYDLSIPFDFTTASHVQTLSLGSINPYGIKFSPTGDRLFVLNSTGPLLQWISTGPYSLSTAGSWQSYNYGTANMGNTRGIAFNTDGTKMTVLTYGGTSGIHEFDLTTGFDPSTATYNSVYFNASTYNISVPMNHWFNSTGTTLYVANYSGNKIHAFYLATPFDISSSNVTVGPVSGSAPGGGEQHQHVFNADETELYVIKSGTSSAGSIISMSFVEETGVQDGDEFTFNNRDYIYDGTKGAWEVNSPITVAQTGSPVSDLSELADSTSILNDPANEVLTYADLDAILAVTDPATGQLAFNLDTSDMYIFGGTNWQKVYDEDDVPPPPPAYSWGGDRAFYAGGLDDPLRYDNIQYWEIATPGNASVFGNLETGVNSAAAMSDSNRIVIAEGSTNGGTSDDGIQYFASASLGNASLFGTISTVSYLHSGCSDGTYGVWGGGVSTAIQYVTIQTTGNSSSFGTLPYVSYGRMTWSDATYGLFAGGSDTGGTNRTTIDYITIASPSDSTTFGDITQARRMGAGAGDTTRSLFGCGLASSNSNVIDYVTTATTGSATDFGDSTTTRERPAASSDGTYANWAGGGTWPTGPVATGLIDVVTIQTPSNATDFGDLTTTNLSAAGSSGSSS